MNSKQNKQIATVNRSIAELREQASPGFHRAVSSIWNEAFDCGIDRPAYAVPAIPWGGWRVGVTRIKHQDAVHAVPLDYDGEPIKALVVVGRIRDNVCGPYILLRDVDESAWPEVNFPGNRKVWGR